MVHVEVPRSSLTMLPIDMHILIFTFLMLLFLDVFVNSVQFVAILRAWCGFCLNHLVALGVWF